MTNSFNPRSEGFGREASLEASRGLHRPAEAHLDALDRRSDPRPDRWIHFSPDVDEDAET
jgi:hypothetical protein